MTTALIDGDIFIYQASSANEYETQWSPWLWTLHADLDAAIAQFDDTLAKLQEEAEAESLVVVLTDPVNWRKSVMPTYKEHRTKTRKPVIYQAMREYAAEKYKTYMRPTLEGDDLLGILATHKHLIPGEKIIVSIDKDMKTIPGVHLRLDDPERSRRVISVEEADRFHLFQTITGDTTDGYPGAPGFGPVKADALLSGGRVLEPTEKVLKSGPRKGQTEITWTPGREGTPWEIVVSAYRAAGLNEEVALQNARVARICRASDYDFERKEVKLWHP